MNKQVRDAVRQAMEKRDMSQGDLAKLLSVERPNLTRLLNGRSGQVPKMWQEVFNALGLEIIVVPKSGSVSKPDSSE
ncbi:helix-turn-helix transcriptional regulator [Deinococcus metalli]|uniref:helix-turn-helix transcriptional regulator n=2 Tax=Deinococcus metalli TaxID=1141878 RepID=UPI00161A4191